MRAARLPVDVAAAASLLRLRPGFVGLLVLEDHCRDCAQRWWQSLLWNTGCVGRTRDAILPWMSRSLRQPEGRGKQGAALRSLPIKCTSTHHGHGNGQRPAPLSHPAVLSGADVRASQFAIAPSPPLPSPLPLYLPLKGTHRRPFLSAFCRGAGRI